MSSTSKALYCKDSTREESGWTTYLEDFFNTENKCSISSDMEFSSSPVSGAASFPVKKVSQSKQIDQFSVDRKGQRSSFKNRKKTKAALFHDDDLEDTASSPVSIPKEKGSTSGQEDKRKELGFDGSDIIDCEELKKTEFCLFPFSMAVNYTI